MIKYKIALSFLAGILLIGLISVLGIPVKAQSPEQGAVKFKTVSYIDEQGTGTEAFRMLIPSNWELEGGVNWVLDNPKKPTVSFFRIYNPQGTEEFTAFPNLAFFWTDNQLILMTKPIGSQYFGNIVMPPVAPLQALEEIVLPVYRGNVQDLQIIDEQDFSGQFQPLTADPSGVSTSIEAGKIRVEYVENGINYEDELFCLVESLNIPSGMTTSNWWGVNSIYSFRAEKGKLDASAKTFQTMSYSIQINLQWFNTYMQVVNYLIQMNIEYIKTIGELGSIIAQTGSEIRQENLDLYNWRSSVSDTISYEFSRNMLEVENYYNPVEEKNVELPSGYDNVWTNDLGEYMLSESPGYNPNIGSNQNWQRIDKAQ